MPLTEAEIGAILAALRGGARASHGEGRGATWWGFRDGNFYSEVADFDPDERILDEPAMRREIGRFPGDFRRLL
jgi:hypothetical protein